MRLILFLGKQENWLKEIILLIEWNNDYLKIMIFMCFYSMFINWLKDYNFFTKKYCCWFYFFLLIIHSLTAVFINRISSSIFVFRSSFVVYDRKYLGHNKNEKQSEWQFSLFEVHITLGFKSEVFAFIYFLNANDLYVILGSFFQ